MVVCKISIFWLLLLTLTLVGKIFSQTWINEVPQNVHGIEPMVFISEGNNNFFI